MLKATSTAGSGTANVHGALVLPGPSPAWYPVIVGITAAYTSTSTAEAPTVGTPHPAIPLAALLRTACRPAATATRVVEELQAQLTAVHRVRSAPCRACRVHYSVSSCATCLRATALFPCSFLLHCSAACCICLSAFLPKAMALEDRLALPSWRQDAQRSWRLHNEAGTQSYGPRRNAGKGRLWCVQEQGGGQTWHGEQTVLQTTAVEEVSESRGAKREGHG